MTSKKHWTLRAAGLLFALVLITSCFVGGTFAKYVTSKSASDIARVARFGVEITAEDHTAFKTTYTTDATGLSIGVNSVISSIGTSGTRDKVVAPGTGEDKAATLSITGTPEVAVHVELTMSGMDVFLRAGDHPDLTATSPTATFNLADRYYPVVFTLKQNDAELKSGTISEINTYLATLSKNYDAGTDLGTKFGTYTLSWKWAFEDAGIAKKDQADTLLGFLAANNTAFGYRAMTDYNIVISFTLAATVTQID